MSSRRVGRVFDDPPRERWVIEDSTHPTATTATNSSLLRATPRLEAPDQYPSCYAHKGGHAMIQGLSRFVAVAAVFLAASLFAQAPQHAPTHEVPREQAPMEGGTPGSGCLEKKPSDPSLLAHCPLTWDGRPRQFVL